MFCVWHSRGTISNEEDVKEGEQGASIRGNQKIVVMPTNLETGSRAQTKKKGVHGKTFANKTSPYIKGKKQEEVINYCVFIVTLFLRATHLLQHASPLA